MKKLFAIILSVLLLAAGCSLPEPGEVSLASSVAESGAGAWSDASAESSLVGSEESGSRDTAFDYSKIPAFTGSAFTVVNGNVPYFETSELTDKSFEFYSELDSLGRCGYVMSSVGRDLMPTEERGEIGMVKPTGWHTVKYDFVDGKYLYNRCHLLGWQLTGENANTKNLITGTRFMNVQGMLPFENMIADYVKETGNHVLYRVTPIFVGEELLARGVLMEGLSVEDSGEEICFNVFCYNAQSGVTIDFATGESTLAGNEIPNDSSVPEQSEQPAESSRVEESSEPESQPETETKLYVLNKNTKKFHHLNCRSVKQISEKNYAERECTRQELIDEGYDPCGICHP